MRIWSFCGEKNKRFRSTEKKMGELPMKVLLVDDESYMTEYHKKLVDWKSYGFEEVLTASGGSIARDLIEQKKPELLVTDIRMPRVSGLDLVKYIDEKNYPTKTIILSGYSEFEYAQQALRYGVTEYLVKPILKNFSITNSLPLILYFFM